MKMPVSLSKGLNDEQLKDLERELKSSTLAKLLKSHLKSEIEALYREEEYLEGPDVFHQHCMNLGERRGYRSILKLFPEE